MTTYSLLIEDATKQELIDLLDVFLKASSKKPAKCPTIDAFHQNMINLHEGRSVSQRDQVQSCAYCGKPIEGANGRQFCSSRCNCLFVCYPTSAVKCPRLDNLSGKENISKPNRSIDAEAKNARCAHCGTDLGTKNAMDEGRIMFCSCYCMDVFEEDHPGRIKIIAYIRDCLRHGLDYSDILFSLKQLKGISMSPAELAGYLEELT